MVKIRCPFCDNEVESTGVAASLSRRITEIRNEVRTRQRTEVYSDCLRVVLDKAAEATGAIEGASLEFLLRAARNIEENARVEGIVLRVR